jgi:hypothetical protein
MRALLLIHGAVLQVAGFMSWKLQQLRSEGSENPAQVLSTARNAIRRVRMVMRGLPQRELTEEGKRLIGSIQHEAAQDTKQARLRCASSSSASCAAAAASYATAVGLPGHRPTPLLRAQSDGC